MREMEGKRWICYDGERLNERRSVRKWEEEINLDALTSTPVPASAPVLLYSTLVRTLIGCSLVGLVYSCLG